MTSGHVFPSDTSPTNSIEVPAGQLSEQLTRLVSGLGTSESHCPETGPGQVGVGFELSSTFTVLQQDTPGSAQLSAIIVTQISYEPHAASA